MAAGPCLLRDKTRLSRPCCADQVPTLIDTNGTKVTESSVVVEYLDAAYPDSGPRLVPSSPADAASARLFSNIFQSSFLQR